MRGVTLSVAAYIRHLIIISTHTPHARRDLPATLMNIPFSTFQLTRLMRGVTTSLYFMIRLNEFQLTRLMRGVTA